MHETKTAVEVLHENAAQIYRLISQQTNHLCLAQCPAFEEVVDTQMYGLSKQIDFAVSMGLIDVNEGHKIMADLEYALNDVYTQIYEKTKETR